MVGEIRDEHTAQFAFNASLTGHLVLSTLHAKDALGTVHRLLEMGIKPSDLQQSLIAVAALELLPINVNDTAVRRAAILELLDGDRKSTRLNSSHVAISYAVFCLKKKRTTLCTSFFELY